MKTADKDKKRKRGAMYFTAFFHAVLMLVFLLVSWKEPFPLPEPKSVEIEFIGGSGSSGGSSSPAAETTPTEVNNTPENLLTETESEVEVPKNPTNVTTNQSNTRPNPTETQPNPNSLFGGMSGNGEKGNSTGTSTGNGEGGSGNGNSTGDGSGEGVFKGPGVSMKGRKQVASPTPENPNFERGKVFFTIYVNRSGVVTKAIFDAANSTTNDPDLIASCKKELIGKQIVNADANAAEEQKGSYMFEFNIR